MNEIKFSITFLALILGFGHVIANDHQPPSNESQESTEISTTSSSVSTSNSQSQKDNDAPTTYRGWSDLLPDDFDGALQDNQNNDVTSTTYKQSTEQNAVQETEYAIVYEDNTETKPDVTIEEYLNDLYTEAKKAFVVYSSNNFDTCCKSDEERISQSNLKGICEIHEERAIFLRMVTYMENAFRNKIDVTEEEYIDFLRSIGASNNQISHAVLSIKDLSYYIESSKSSCMSQYRSWGIFLGKAALVAGGITALYQITKKCLRRCFAKRTQKKQQESTVATQEFIVFEVTK